MKNKASNIKSTNEVNVLILLFFVVTLAEVLAEFFSFSNFIYLLKPLICPILIVIYWKSSVKKSEPSSIELKSFAIKKIFATNPKIKASIK